MVRKGRAGSNPALGTNSEKGITYVIPFLF